MLQVAALAAVWVSHKHADHLLGLPALLAARSWQAPPLIIIGVRRGPSAEANSALAGLGRQGLRRHAAGRRRRSSSFVRTLASRGPQCPSRQHI
jgi:ribonuclease BN (tRNA processing enzyme)